MQKNMDYSNDKPVGLVMTFRGSNYGAQLQAFALQKFVQYLGYKTVVFNYLSLGKKKIFWDRGLIFYFFHEGIKRIKSKLIKNNTYTHLSNYINDRKKIADAFVVKYIEDKVICNNYEQLQRIAEKCRSVVVGSDQLWTPGASFGNFYSLRFVPKGIKRISYATSLGVTEYPWYCMHSAREMWQNFDYLSVREKQGQVLIENIIDKDTVKTVVDPTYLFSKEQWCNLVPTNEMCKETYLFSYFLGFSKEQRLFVKKFAKQNKLKIVSLVSDESLSDDDLNYADIYVKDATPFDFINWIRGARYVFTDSFHGMAFSILNEKQFYVFYRIRRGEISRNSRIDNIIEKWNLQDRLVVDYSRKIGLDEINYDDVNTLINIDRTKSIQFLEEALRQ